MHLHDGGSTCFYFVTNSANILLDEHMKAKIADFNLAKEATKGSTTGEYTHVSTKQMSEVMCGSKAYLPKDFFRDEANFSTASDVFSFGMVNSQFTEVRAIQNIHRSNEFGRISHSSYKIVMSKVVCFLTHR